MTKTKPAKGESFFDKETLCDFCKATMGSLRLAEARHCEQVIATCQKCMATGKTEREIYGFQKWAEPERTVKK